MSIKCKPILELQLDDKSLKMIEEIRQKSNMGKLLELSVDLGAIINIFTRSNPVLAYNITKMDWNLFNDVIKDLPDITRAAIKRDIRHTFFYYKMNPNSNSKILRFWQGLYYACE